MKNMLSSLREWIYCYWNLFQTGWSLFSLSFWPLFEKMPWNSRQFPRLKFGYWWLQTVQARKERKRLCPLHQGRNRVWRAVPEECPWEVESLWVRVSEWGNEGSPVVAVYYRPPGQVWSLLIKPSSSSYRRHLNWRLSSCRGTSTPDIRWKNIKVSCKQSRRLLKCFEGNFLSQ